LIRAQRKEIKQRDAEIDNLFYVDAFNQLYKRLCEEHKKQMQSANPDNQLIDLLRKFLPIIKDVERIALKRVEERTNKVIENKAIESKSSPSSFQPINLRSRATEKKKDSNYEPFYPRRKETYCPKAHKEIDAKFCDQCPEIYQKLCAETKEESKKEGRESP